MRRERAMTSNEPTPATSTPIVGRYSHGGTDNVVRCPHRSRLVIVEGRIFGKRFSHSGPGYPGIGRGGHFEVARDARLEGEI